MQLRPRAAAPVPVTTPAQYTKIGIILLKQELKYVKQRVVAAETKAEVTRQQKIIAEAALRDVKEDLIIQQETTMQVTTMLDTWQDRFDRVYQLAEAAGADPAILVSIRDGVWV